jgi:hypothetical protein
MADITLLPSAKVPLIYPDTNRMTTEWYRFFWNVYGFTGDSSGAVPVNKGGTGLTTIGDHQIIIGNANNVFEPAVFTGSGINISYAPGVVNLAIGASGVTPGTYGSASQVGVFTVNQYGNITAAVNTSIGIDANQIISGTLSVIRGGTGQSTYTDGQLLIGNSTGNTLTKATLTAGTGISVTNGAGSITIANTGVLSVSGTAPVVSSGGATPAISMAAANTTTNGYLTSTDWNTFNNKAPATSGTSILYGNGSGGFSNVTIGSGISFAGGTLSATGSGGTVTAVTGVAPIASSGGTTPAISISQATTSTDGYLSSTDWNTFNNKQPAGSYLTAVSVVSANGFAGTSSGGTTPALTLSTSITGILKGNGTAISAATSGTDYAPATSGSSILYGNGAGGFSNVTIGTGVSFAGGTLSATGTGGTVTSVAALTLGTTGTDLSSTVANSTTTPVITLNVPTASAANRGALSAADWTTFNSKAPAFTYTTGYIPFGQGTTTPAQDSSLFWDNTNKRLGIGTNAPATLLNVKGYSASNWITTLQNTGASGHTAYFGYNDGTLTTYGLYITGGLGTSTSIDLTVASKFTVYGDGGVSVGSAASPGANNLSVVGTGKFGTTVGVGAATPSASGAGVTFPATQSASTDVNTLDDYEEGTFTPTVVSTSGTITTVGATTGQYTKIGDLVTVIVFLPITNNGTGAGLVRVTNMPFACNATASSYGSGREQNVTGNGLFGYINAGTQNLYIQRYDGAYPGGTGYGVGFTITYKV